MAQDLQELERLSLAFRLTRAGILVDGVRFDLSRYPYLTELYDDIASWVVVRKGAQLGLTAWAILSVIERMRAIYRRGVLYTFPSDDEVYDFAQSRFERILRDNPEFAHDIKGTDRVTLKRIGDAFLYFRGMKSRSKLLSIPVDCVVFDEIGEMEPEMVRVALQRLAGSDYRHVIMIGHPTIPAYGIDLEWEESDKRHWFIRCGACGEWTCLELEFPDCLVRRDDGTVIRACRRCRREIFVRDGEWVPAERDREKRGYWVSQLCSPTVEPGHILTQYEEVMATGHGVGTFHQLVLGMPWADHDDALTEADVRSVCDSQRPTAVSDVGPCWLGADVGASKIYVVVGRRIAQGRYEVLSFSECSGFGELEAIGRRFRVQVGCIDAQAETRTVREFVRQVPWAWGVWYSDSQRGAYKWDAAERWVYVNRTEALDASHRAMVERRVTFPRESSYFLRYVVPQLVNLVRVIAEDPRTGVRKPRWVVRGQKNDHFRHALCYGLVAAERVALWRGLAKLEAPRVERPRHWLAM